MPPIDPNKMEAFMQVGPKPEGGDLSGFKKGGEAKSEEPKPPSEDMKEGGQGRFGSLIPLLEESAEELEACCDELDPEQLGNPNEPFDEENHDIFIEAFSDLPEDLQDELMSVLAEPLEVEEAEELGAHLEGEGMVTDGERIGNYLRHVCRAIEDGEIGEEMPEDAEDTESGEEGEGEESGEEEPAEPEGGAEA